MSPYSWLGDRAPRWVIAGLAVACVAIGVVVIAAFTSRGDQDSSPGKKEINTPTSLATLVEGPAQRQSIGAIVFLNDVRVTPGLASNVFVARDSNGRELVVRYNDVKDKVPSTGTVADVTGVVRPLPSAANLRKQWKFDKKTAERFRNDEIYIEAERIKPERKAQGDSRQDNDS